jgi:hypothetical protein
VLTKTKMQRILLILILIPVVLLTYSCGYTIIQKNNIESPPPTSLSDLVIANVSSEPDYSIWMDGDNETPSWFFYITITNVGDSLFDNSAMIAWSVGSSNVAWGDYSHQFSIGHLKISPGDTITTKIALRNCGYESGFYLRFLLATESVMSFEPCKAYFASAPMRSNESNYKNNYYDYIIP